MAGALLGSDMEQNIRSNKKKDSDKKPSKLAHIGQRVMLGLLAVLTLGTVFTGGTAKAAIWDLDEQITAAIVNICNPNEVPYTTDTQSWLDNALGSAKPMPAEGVNENGNIWSTYNPQITDQGGDTRYIEGGAISDVEPGNPNQATATASWINFLRSSDDGKEFPYPDHWSERDKVDETDVEWREHFSGDGKAAMYPANPSSSEAYYYNAPTVALQSAYESAPSWVIHPSYTRYGFETLDWTTYGSSCYAPERYLNIVPDFLYWLLVQIPTLITFGMLRLTLGGELVSVFYELVYPLTSLIGTIITPWVALIAIVIGLPFVWIKSKGSLQKILGGAAWIAAMLFAISQLTQHAEGFTNFTQGLVVKVSGTFACTIANQAYAEDAGTIKIGGDAIKDEQYVPVYNSDGTVKKDANGETQWMTRQQADDKVRKAAEEGREDGNGDVLLNLDDLKGLEQDTNTACGSYLDGIYNAYWQGVPLQVWAEGQVGSAQAARDRTSEGEGRIGWYQATLNAMYINPDDSVGKAQIQSTTRWNDAGYTDLDEGKPMQWNIDGRSEGTEGDIDLSEPINSFDKQKTATVWKAVPFLLNVKFMCKDDSIGAIENSGANGADNAADYATNKWLYDGTCITAGNSGLVNGLTGYNLIDRIGLSLVGGWLAMVIFLFTVAGCIYIGYQKFVWGFMLMFAPIFLGIAAFPDEKRKDFARKYLEFVLANVLKQIMAVMILVVTVTALAKVVFPSSDALGGEGFYIPWMLKPFVAIMFLLAAALFAIPMKRIMVGAVKGDSSVVNKTAEMAGDAAKGVGTAALAAGAIAATGGAGSGAVLGTMGKMAATQGMRKGGMTGALANVAGRELAGKGSAMESAKAAAAAEQGIEPSTGGLLSSMRRDRALKKATGTNALSQKAALDANKAALAAGAALPYATDDQGNLTKSAQKQAKSDFVAAQKGQFWKSPEFTSDIRNKNANAGALAGIKDSLTPEFTDENGVVDEKGLDAAANKQLGAMNDNSLARHTAIGKNLLAEDAKRDVADRKYLDENGKLDPASQASLFRDIRAIDGKDVGINNIAKAHELRAENPEHYNQFVSAENPNGDYIQSLNDANVANYGVEGSVGSRLGSAGFAAGNEFQQINGSQAYLSAQAPVIGTDINDATASVQVQEIGGTMAPQSPAVAQAFQNYSDVLSNSDADMATVENAHINALETAYNTTGLTPTTQTVQSQVLNPVMDHGVNISPEVVQDVSASLPASSVAVKQSLDNYAATMTEFGEESDQSRHAFNDVRQAVTNEDRGVYANLAAQTPMPSSVTGPSDGGGLTPTEPLAPSSDPAPQAEVPVERSEASPAPMAPAPQTEAPRASEASSGYSEPSNASAPSDPAPRVQEYSDTPQEVSRPTYDDAPVAPMASPTYDDAPISSPDYVDEAPTQAPPVSQPTYDDAPIVNEAPSSSADSPRNEASSGLSDSAATQQNTPFVPPVVMPARESQNKEVSEPVEENNQSVPSSPEQDWDEDEAVLGGERDMSNKSDGTARINTAIQELAKQHKSATNHLNKLEGLKTRRAAENDDDKVAQIDAKMAALRNKIKDFEREIQRLNAQLKDKE